MIELVLVVLVFTFGFFWGMRFEAMTFRARRNRKAWAAWSILPAEGTLQEERAQLDELEGMK